MPHLKDHGLEHRHRVEGRAAALGPVAMAQTPAEPWPELFEVDRRFEDLQRVGVSARPHEMLRQPEKRPLLNVPPPNHDQTSKSRHPKPREVDAGARIG